MCIKVIGYGSLFNLGRMDLKYGWAKDFMCFLNKYLDLGYFWTLQKEVISLDSFLVCWVLTSYKKGSIGASRLWSWWNNFILIPQGWTQHTFYFWFPWLFLLEAAQCFCFFVCLKSYMPVWGFVKMVLFSSDYFSFQILEKNKSRSNHKENCSLKDLALFWLLEV